ncbi:MAG: omptin family outer membrane protease [Treponema sp.]|jgi:outer membrane protease|nr:omptin family outer membrane protease [Treponema sp.]
MRNILFFLFSVSVFLVLAVGRSYGFSISPRTGFMLGRGEEIVYNQDWASTGQNKYLSQLLWDFKPLVYIGVDLGFGPPWLNNGFTAGASFKYGLPLNTGIMEDRDWLAAGDSYLTNYSRHDAFSRGSPLDIFSGMGTFTAELSLGYSWAFPAGFWIKAFGALSYLRFSWMSSNGYTQYGPNNHDDYDKYDQWNPAWPKCRVYGPAIAYTQNWVILSPGVELGIKLSGNLTLSVISAWTPLTYSFSKDEHFQRSMVFLDFPYLGLSIREELALGYRINEKIELGLSAAFWNISGARGDSYISSFESHYLFYDGYVAGGGFSFFDFSVSGKYSF